MRHQVKFIFKSLDYWLGALTSQNPSTLPRNQTHIQESKILLDSGTCFRILVRVLESGKCFGFWDVFLNSARVYYSGKCFATISHVTYESLGPLFIKLIGSFSNDDGDGNENVKTAIGFLGKTTSLHVHHAFLYISLPLLHDYDVKMPNFTFHGGRKQATTEFAFSFYYIKLECGPHEINSREISLH